MAKVKLGDVAFEYKQAFNGNRAKVPNVGLEHLVSGEVKLSCWDIDSDNTFTKSFNKGQVLLGRRRAYLKKAVIAPFNGICSGDITVIEAFPNMMLPDLLPFIIQNDRFFDYAIRGSAGSLSPRVKWEYLKEYEFELPPIQVQECLAELLWAAYDLKESYKKLMSATDEMVKAQFIEMYGDLSENTKGLPIKNLSEVASYTIGLTYDPAAIKDKGIIVLRSGNIQNGEIDLNDVVRVDMPIKENLYVKTNDILMCSRNGSAHLVGKVAKIKDPKEIMTYGAFMTIIRSDIPDYLMLFFQSDYFRRQISYGKSSTMNQITQKMLDKVQLPVSNEKSNMDTLSLIIQQANKSKAELKQSIESIDNVMKRLLP